eukprot:gene23151-28135_t
MEVLDESLPSDSRFVGHSLQNTSRNYTSNYPTIPEDDYYEDDYEDYHKDYHHDEHELSRTSSPPPPPPPLSESFIASEQVNKDNKRQSEGFSRFVPDETPIHSTATTPNPAGENKKPERKGPFPFLKKNSRKEPTALNRKQSPSTSPAGNAASESFPPDTGSRPGRVSNNSTQAASNTSYVTTSHTGTASSGGGVSGNAAGRGSASGAGTSGRNAGGSAPSKPSSVHVTADDEVLLQGGDYWGLDSIKQDIQVLEKKRGYGGYADEDSLEQSNSSTITIGLNDWKRSAHHTNNAVDEFEQLERKVDQGSMYDDGRAGSSSSHHARTVSTPTSSDAWGAVTHPHPLARSYVNSSRQDEDHTSPLVNNRAASTANQVDRSRMSSTSTHINPGAASSISSSTKVVRPTSTLSSGDRTGNAVAGGRGAGGRTGSKASSSRSSSVELQRIMEEKAKELENELETYKLENAHLKKLRKQNEMGLQELASKREEVLRWCEEEKQKTTAWCEEQRSMAEKDRRAAAKQARDSRQKASTGSLPIRKEKAELEALQATIEKMKMSQEQQNKKSKMMESRLYGVIKEHMKHIEDLEQQIVALEEQKIMLMDFIAQSNLRLPKHIRTHILASAARAEGEIADGGKGKSFLHNKKMGEAGYVEEVDVEVMGSESVHKHVPLMHSSTAHSSSSGKHCNTYTALHGHAQTPKSSAGAAAKPRARSAPRPGRGAGDSVGVSGTDSGVGIKEVLAITRDSWARSSRSSHRYSTSSADDGDGDTRASLDSGRYGNGYTAEPQGDDRLMQAMYGIASDIVRSSTTRAGSGKSGEDYGEEEAGYGDDMYGLDKKAGASMSKTTMLGITDPIATNGVGAIPILRNSVVEPKISLRTNDSGHAAAHGQAQSSRSSGVVPQSSHTQTPSSHIVAQPSVAPPAQSHGHTQPLPNSAQEPTSRTGTQTTGHQPQSKDGRTEEVAADGTRTVTYRNGTVKSIRPNGEVHVRFLNGDTKTTSADGVVVYFYAQAQTTHTTYTDGVEVYVFPNQQVETHFKDGRKEVVFPDKTKKVMHTNGVQESYFPDGVVLREHPDGRKEVV